METVGFQHGGKQRKEKGRVILEAQDGLVFESRDTQYYILSSDKIIDRESDETPFVHYSKRELLQRLKEEFPESRGFSILQKKHFFVVYTTSKAFADWYGQLLEDLYSGYINFWKGRDITLDKLDVPMVALVYANRTQFFNHAASEGVAPDPQLFAYYNKLSNRVVLCDISGIEVGRQGENRRATGRTIQAFLEQPAAAFNIATVVHEATHQIGFNCGMHERFAPYPLWLCEGLALFHEVPDRGKKAGWSIRPKINDLRLRDLKKYLSRSPQRPLQTLLESDKVLQTSDTAVDNYAMAWGLAYYLIMQRKKEFSIYLKKMAAKTPLCEDTPEIRIQDFEDVFGNDWNALYKACGDYLKNL